MSAARPSRTRWPGERAASLLHGAPLAWPADCPATLPAMLARAAERSPGRGVTCIGEDDGTHALPYPVLWRAAGRIAAGLRAAGAAPCSTVLLALDDTADFFVAFWGCARAGVVPVPLPLATATVQPVQAARTVECWRLLGRPPVVHSGRDLRWAAPWAQERASAPRGLALPTLVAGESDAHPALDPDDLALLLLTSGSTGGAKVVEHTHRAIVTQCAATAQENGFTASDVSLNWFPLEHVGALAMFHLRDVFVACEQLHAPTGPVLREPLRWLDWIERHRVTVTWAPSFAFALLAERPPPERPRRDLSSLRFVLNGGEAVVARHARRFLEVLAPHGVRPDVMHPAWGMSETCSGLTYSHAFASGDRGTGDDEIAHVGRPLPGASLRVVDERGDVLPEGEIGALEVRSPSLTRGYHRDPRATAALFTDDGWLRTGDLARVRDGALQITGRAKEVLIVGGVNHAARDVERVADAVPGVRAGSSIALALRLPGDATDRLAIVFSPDGATAGAGDVATPRGRSDATSATVDRVRAAVAAAVGVAPRVVRALAPDEIPRGAIGKVQRGVLRDRLLAAARDERDDDGARAAGGGVARGAEAAARDPANERDDPLAARVRAIVARVLRASPSDLADEVALADQAPVDSLALVEILAALEDDLALRIRGDALAHDVTLAAIVAVTRTALRDAAGVGTDT